jgi:hypothetical protein
VQFEEVNGITCIAGCSINNVIYGCCLPYGALKTNLSKRDSLSPIGSLDSWKEIAEISMMTILKVITCNEILARFTWLASCYVQNGSEKYGNLLFGALSFLSTWIVSYDSLFDDYELNEVKSFTNTMHRSLSSNNKQISYNKTHNDLNMLIINLCKTILDSLQRIIISRRYYQRDTMNGSSNCIVTARLNPALSNLHGDIHPNEQQVLESNTIQLDRVLVTDPDISESIGIFGASDLFNELISPSHHTHKQGVGMEMEKILIINTQKLYHLPSNEWESGVKKTLSLWCIDETELVKQFSLMDHQLFSSIPMSSYLYQMWIAPRCQVCNINDWIVNYQHIHSYSFI